MMDFLALLALTAAFALMGWLKYMDRNKRDSE